MRFRAIGPLNRQAVDLAVVAIGLVVLILDQAVKHLVTQSLGSGQTARSVEVVGDLLRFSYGTNTGAAFGLFPGLTIVLTIVSLVAVPFLLFSRLFVDYDGILIRLSIGLLLGGDIGNLVDRLRLGHVVDFIDFGIGQVRFYIFNIADAADVVGVALLMFYILFLYRDEETESRAV